MSHSPVPSTEPQETFAGQREDVRATERAERIAQRNTHKDSPGTAPQ